MAGPALTLVTHSNKAVAVGAASFYVDHFVTGRISRFTYGAPSAVSYQSSNHEHLRRKKKIYMDAAGDRRVPGHFESMLLRVCHLPLLIMLLVNFIILQGTKVLEDQELQQPFVFVTEGTPRGSVSSEVVKYTGMCSALKWMDIEPGRVFSFNNLVRDTQVKQTSLRHCALYRRMFRLRHIQQSVGLQERWPRHGSSI